MTNEKLSDFFKCVDNMFLHQNAKITVGICMALCRVTSAILNFLPNFIFYCLEKENPLEL